MNRPSHTAAPQEPPRIDLKEGWHCLHLYYTIDPIGLNSLSDADRQLGREQLVQILSPESEGAPARIQSSIVSGHKGDFGVMAMDPNPMKLDAVQQKLRASQLGPALNLDWSFVSITEVSEYVPTIEQYSKKLQREGTSPDDPAFEAKVTAYQHRLPAMNKQRLYPDFPPYPVTSFYPMNKIRDPQANWFMEPFSSRSGMMSEHATSGIKFAGRVSQLITASAGFDDWEWGVTLWASAPEHIKEIVYTMRFDKASAKYAEFGPFYISYIVSPEDAARHLLL